MDFLRVEQSVRELKRQVTTGEIDQSSFEAGLLALISLADDGYYWMFGHKSEVWYRHDGQKWVADSPGEILMPLSVKSGSNDKVKTVNHRAISYLSVAEADRPEVDWSSLDWGWFIAGLALLIFIAVVIYLATLP